MINNTKMFSHTIRTQNIRTSCSSRIGRCIFDLHEAFGADRLVATSSEINIGRIILHIVMLVSLVSVVLHYMYQETDGAFNRVFV